MIYINGSVYESTWENDKKHGIGTLTLKTGFQLRQNYEYGKNIGMEKEMNQKNSK